MYVGILRSPHDGVEMLFRCFEDSVGEVGERRAEVERESYTPLLRIRESVVRLTLHTRRVFGFGMH
jgi:hypothetical protein